MAVVAPARACASRWWRSPTGAVDLGRPRPRPTATSRRAAPARARRRDAPRRRLRCAASADVAALERDGRRDLLAGEAELPRARAGAVRHGASPAYVGWAPGRRAGGARARSSRRVGAAVVELPPPALGRRRRRSCGRPARRAPFRPLVDMYGAARYARHRPDAVRRRDVRAHVRDDVRRRRPRPGARRSPACSCARTRAPARAFRALWPLPVACGLCAAALGGLLYGEAFGPTGLVPTLWLATRSTTRSGCSSSRIGVGAVLLVVELRDRHRQPLARARASPPRSSRPSASPGSLVLLVGGGRGVLGARDRGRRRSLAGGGASPPSALAPAAVGFLRERGPRRRRRVAEAVVELVRRRRARRSGNTVSFARLAAFGLDARRASAAVVSTARRALRGGPLGWRSPSPVRRRQRPGVRPRGARRRRPGPAPRVLRAVLPRLRRRGPSLRAVAYPARHAEEAQS